MTPITIKIYSDTICPWCYIGKRFLDRAMTSFQSVHANITFDISWHPFLLHPSTITKKVTGIPKMDFFQAKYGPSTPAFLSRVEKVGDEVGINFDWSGNSGGSVDSLVLVLYAGRKGGWERQGRLLDEIFEGHFERGRDISDRKFLGECGVAAGVCETEEEVGRVLEDGDGDGHAEQLKRRVVEEDAAARGMMGVEAVPSYLVQGRWFVGGMQRPEVFMELFERVVGDG